MADLKRHMYRHLCAARQWVTKAEESFDKDCDVRGELDLLLAQAELQHVREANHSRSWRYKYPLLCHGLALGLAMITVAAGIGGGYWWMHAHDKTQPIPLVTQESKMIPVHQLHTETAALLAQPVELSRESAVAVSTTEVHQSKPAAVEPREVTNGARTDDREVQVPVDEMHKLIQAAGKSLRGQ